MMTMLSLMQLRSITNPGVLAFLFFAPCSLFFCQQITYYLASVFFCSGALHFIASNNDCGVRDFERLIHGEISVAKVSWENKFQNFTSETFRMRP